MQIDMKKCYLSVFIIVFFFTIVKGQDFTIKIPSSVPVKMVYLKDYFTSVNYLPLETTDECLIGNSARYHVIEDYILVTSLNYCYLFNLNNGDFIRNIGIRGNGPGEYSSGLGYYNPHSKTIYFKDWGNSLVKYSLEGKFLGKVKVPESSSSIEKPSYAANFSFLSENKICVFFSNLNGAESKRIMVFSESGDIIKLFPNNRIIKTNGFVFTTFDGTFYKNNDKLFFKEAFVDTVYIVSEKKISSAYIIDQGKYKITYEERYDNPNKYQPLQSIMENSNYIVLELNIDKKLYYTIYDKKKNNYNSYAAKEGFIDNINNFIPFRPSTVSDDGALVGIIEAHKVYEELEKIKTENRPELAPLSKVKEDDNPIMIIVR